METQETQREIYGLFYLSVLLKGALSAVEVLGGIFFLLVPPHTITALGEFLTQDALADDPDNYIASHLLQYAQSYSHNIAVFAGIYLITRGAIKLALIIALLKNKIWAYPAALAVLALFVAYQIYHIIVHHSPIVILITMFDLIVMYFIWREYRIVRARAAAKV
jgi:uncharacterized membrane protein